MPLQATSGAASYDAFGGGVAAVPNYIEDVFSTYLYTGNGSTQTITNGIDLSTKGGLVWIKKRNEIDNHFLFDTNRGATFRLISNATNASSDAGDSLVAFNSNGFNLDGGYTCNGSGNTLVSWTFRRQPKFFDVVTWTGDASGNRVLNHALTSTPACIIIKATNAVDDWYVYHTSLGTNKWLYLNTTSAEQSGSIVTAVSSTTFTVSQSNGFNTSGRTYVAYLFAHNAGGFGLTGTDNVISCGSFTTDASGRTTIDLGYEPQWVLIKRATGGTGNWEIADNMRRWTVSGNAALYPNLSNAENNPDNYKLNATGFSTDNGVGSSDFIYIAIRRGPMKVPTSGTSVFVPIARTGTQTNNTTVSGAGFAPDLVMAQNRAGITGNGDIFFDKLRGAGQYLNSASTGAEGSAGNSSLIGFTNDGFITNADATSGYINYATTYANWLLQRAPSFFDEVCYTGTGSNATVKHNLTVRPEVIITKRRDAARNWAYYTNLGATAYTAAVLNDTYAPGATPAAYDTALTAQPSSTEFYVGTSFDCNASGGTYVAYLFATCAGVSKVFSYTGNGSSQTINCGFTAGARWILIKRTDSTGDWYVWDSARGIVSGNDPHLSLNTTAAEVTTDDTIDTDSTGFVVNQVSATNVNVSSATYIGIAIA